MRGGKRENAGRPQVQDKKKTVSVALTDAELWTLDLICKKNGVSRSAAVALMIADTVARDPRYFA